MYSKQITITQNKLEFLQISQMLNIKQCSPRFSKIIWDDVSSWIYILINTCWSFSTLNALQRKKSQLKLPLWISTCLLRVRQTEGYATTLTLCSILFQRKEEEQKDWQKKKEEGLYSKSLYLEYIIYLTFPVCLSVSVQLTVSWRAFLCYLKHCTISRNFKWGIC